MDKKNYREIAKNVEPCKCFCCGKIFNKIIVHHMDGNNENNYSKNLVKVCQRCHHLIHWGSRRRGEIERFIIIGSLRKFLFKKRNKRVPSPEIDFTIKAIQPIYIPNL